MRKRRRTYKTKNSVINLLQATGTQPSTSTEPNRACDALTVEDKEGPVTACKIPATPSSGDCHDDTQQGCSFSVARSDKEVYVSLLLDLKAFTPVGNDFCAFVMKDFSCTSKKLEDQKFLVVSRSAKSFIGKAEWVYACSCDVPRSSVVKALSREVMEDFCKHSYTLRIERKQSKVGIYEVSWDGNTFCVWDEEDHEAYGLCSFKQGQLRCFVCRHSKTNCHHIKFLNRALTDSANDVPASLAAAASKCSQYQPGRESPLLNCISTKEIPFDFPPELQHILKLSTEERLQMSGDVEYALPVLKPKPSGECPVCHSPWGDSVSTSDLLVPLVDRKQTFHVKVHRLPCSIPSCSGSKVYEGIEQCFLHLNKLIVAYEVFLDFMDLFVRTRTTIYGYYLTMLDSHKRCGDVGFQSVMSATGFRWAWYSFFKLVRSSINFQDGFNCPDCGPHPDKIIMDATTMAHRKSFATWIDFLNQESQAGKEDPVSGRSSEQRIFLVDRRLRFLLSCFSGWSEGHPLTQGEFMELLNGFQSLADVLVPLMKIFQRDQLTSVAPPEFRPLLRALASRSPVCSFISAAPRCQTLMQKLVDGVDLKKYPDELRILSEEVPVLFSFLQSLEATPKELSALVKHLMAIAKAPFGNMSLGMGKATTNSNDCGGGYFPSLLKVRDRLRYRQDSNKPSLGCKSQGTSHPSLLPGIFCLFCQHGICYGFQLMKHHESPNVPFTVILTRFRIAPSVVVYDNGCNLHEYFLNRRPLFVQNTRFLIDRLHWHNHKGCSDGYNIDSYPQYKALNSQVAEQANSSIGHLKSMLSYMNHENFMNHVIFYVWRMNMLKLDR